VSNILHRVIRGKEEYNNLIEFEHTYFENLQKKLGPIKLFDRDVELMKPKIPDDKPVLERARRVLDTLEDGSESPTRT